MKERPTSSLCKSATLLDSARSAIGPRHALLPRLAIFGMVLALLGLPITDLWSFLLLLGAIIGVAFGTTSQHAGRWLLACLIAIAGIAAGWLLPGPQIEEGENVYIPLGRNLEVFERELPAAVNARLKAEFERAYLATSESSGPRPESLFRDGRSIHHAFSPSADALWHRPKYSRTVDGVSFNNQEQARIGAINRTVYNFYRRPKRLHAPGDPLALENNLNPKVDNRSAIDRNRIPFFVMTELNSALLSGMICWRGDVLWEQEQGSFDLLRNESWACRDVAQRDLGKRIFALSIGSPLEFEVTPVLEVRLAVWTRTAARTIALLGILGLLVTVRNTRRLLLPIGAAVSTLVTTTILWPQYLLGFRTLEGGNDGLIHESMGFDIAQALHDGRWGDALRGGESMFYYMPGLRYFRALEQFLFGETNFGIVLCTMFFPVFLYYLLRRLLPLRWSIALICIFLFTPIFERFGFAHFVYIKEMIKGFPEPVGYTAFLGGLALLAQYIPTSIPGDRPGPMPSGWIALALAVGVALRPNLALPAGLILAMTGSWLLIHKRWEEVIGLAFGFAPVLLIPLHNWYFGHEFVPLTSSAFTPDNLTAPPSVYWAAITEIGELDFSGRALAQVLRQLGRWNGITDFYRVIAVLVVVWSAFRNSSAPSLRGLALVALSMQATLLFYVPSGRYALLAWLLVFTIFVVEMREAVLAGFGETSARGSHHNKRIHNGRGSVIWRSGTPV